MKKNILATDLAATKLPSSRCLLDKKIRKNYRIDILMFNLELHWTNLAARL